MRPFAGEVTPALEAQVAEAWMSVLGQSDAIADDICLSLLEKDPEVYERTGPEFQADVRASTRGETGRTARDVLCAPPNAQPVRSDQGGAHHSPGREEVRR